MGLRTPLYDLHVAVGARMVDFGGWDMPVNYGSQIEEHHAVRRDAGMFDVSHMCVVDLRGDRVRDFLRHLLANDVAKLTQSGKALYSCMLREDGGVIDDLIVYYLDEQWFRMVVNAGTRDKDLAWLRAHAGGFGVRGRAALRPGDDRGAGARTRAAGWRACSTRAFAARALELGNFFGARTPTGSSRAPATPARTAWRSCCRPTAAATSGAACTRPACSVRPRRARHAAPRGRHEPLRQRHGRDAPPRSNRASAGPSPGSRRDRDFVGRGALAAQKAQGVARKLVGLLLAERAVLRPHQQVIVRRWARARSPAAPSRRRSQRSIALARVPAETGDRAGRHPRPAAARARVVRPPFVRHGKVAVAL